MSVMPPSPLSLDALLDALSLITSRRESRHPSPGLATNQSSINKHLKLLNLLSLLLVTSKKGDVAAVSLYLRSGSAELYYAKNRPCSAAERSYIADLFKVVTSTDFGPDQAIAVTLKQHYIVMNAIRNCRPKINSRIRRVCARLNALSLQNFSISVSACENDSDTANFIRDKIGERVFLPDESLEFFLQTWFGSLLTMEYTTVKPGGIIQLFMICHSVGNSPAIETILDGTLINRLRKLGDYHAAPRALTTAMAQLTAPQLRGLSFIEVTPEKPHPLLLPTNHLTTINNWAHYSDNNPVTVAELNTSFPNATNPPSLDALKSVLSSVHCECTLVMAHLSFPSAPSVCEIGVSKSSCWMCREFIRIVERLYPTRKIHVSSCHGKMVAGWRLPASASTQLIMAVGKRVQDEIDEVLDRTARKKKSDSLHRGTESESGETSQSALITKLMDDEGGVWVREETGVVTAQG